MDGLLLRLLDDSTGRPGFYFWKLFGPIRQDLDRLAWCFPWPPWMGSPPGFEDDESALVNFEGQGRTSIQLWRPRTLARYADRFGEEEIELWGIEPTRDDPQRVASRYSATPWNQAEQVVRQYAQVWLLYTDSTCWEIYARKTSLLERLRQELARKPWVRVYSARDDQRERAFRSAGLSDVWRALHWGRT